MRAWSGSCRLVLLACLLFVLAGGQAATAFAAGRYALVIGNSTYENAPFLPNAANDARDLDAVLRKLGFVVDLGIDLDKSSFRNLVSDFRAKVKAANAEDVVFFYAGHGFTLDGLNQLVPADAGLNDKKLLPYETLRLDEVIDDIHVSKSQSTVILLDACSNNPLPKQLQDSDTASGLARLQTSTKGKFIVYATQPGQVTRDGKGKNSPFTTALLTYIEEPAQSLNDLLIKVTNDVDTATNGEQLPYVQTTPTRNFYFNPASQTAPASEQVVAALPAAQPAGDASQPTAQPQGEECPFGCDVDVASPPQSPASGASGPVALRVADATVAAEVSGEALEGKVMGAPDAGAVPVEGSPEQALAGTEMAALAPSETTRSASAKEQPSAAALPQSGNGTLLSGNEAAAADAPDAASGEVVEGTEIATAGSAEGRDPLPSEGTLAECQVLESADGTGVTPGVTGDVAEQAEGPVIQGTVQPEPAPFDVAALPPQETPRDPPPLPDDLRLHLGIQEQLARVGCYKGKVDGHWGPGSQDALREYFKRRKQPDATATPSEAVLNGLTAESGGDVCVASIAPPEAPRKEKLKADKPKAAKPAPPLEKQKASKPKPQPKKSVTKTKKLLIPRPTIMPRPPPLYH